MENLIVIATHNQRKLTEFQALLQATKFRFIALDQFNVPAVEETGLSFVENALIKARYAAKISGHPAIADDSGIVVPALNGAPGIYSARYAGENASDQDNIKKLLTQMKNLNDHQREAYFRCAIVYVEHEKDPIPIICEGTWQGTVLMEPQGKNGFGYDPIFYVPSHHCSAAELSIEEKNKISHRGKALNLFANTELRKNFSE